MLIESKILPRELTLNGTINSVAGDNCRLIEFSKNRQQMPEPIEGLEVGVYPSARAGRPPRNLAWRFSPGSPIAHVGTVAIVIELWKRGQEGLVHFCI